jgi:hypothetical protein
MDVIDNGTAGTFDFFSIHLSNGYSVTDNLTSGDIQFVPDGRCQAKRPASCLDFPGGQILSN